MLPGPDARRVPASYPTTTMPQGLDAMTVIHMLMTTVLGQATEQHLEYLETAAETYQQINCLTAAREGRSYNYYHYIPKIH